MKLIFNQLHKHPTHKETLIKFLLLFGVLVAYFGYLSWEYDITTGGIVAGLTWSFFVLCTPVADAGFLLDFPIRLLFGIKMIIIEVLVWVIAISINIVGVIFYPTLYETTFLTGLFYKILTTPFPYWSIILLCGVGTFLSIYFGDEMLDVTKHKDCIKCHRHKFKYKMISMVALFVLIVFAYYYLLESLGINID